MTLRRFAVLTLTTVSLGALAGCGHSEDEWQAKLRDLAKTNQALDDERAAHQKAQSELDEAQKSIDALRGQLKSAGVESTNLKSDLEQTRAALEKLAKDKAQLDLIRQRFEALKGKLDKLTSYGLTVVVRKNRIVVQLPGDVLFDSGRADLKKDGKEILGRIAEVIRNDPGLKSRSFQVAGHTDAKAFAGGEFKDNWGLSAMRARTVLLFLTTPVEAKHDPGGGLPAENWSAAGYADTDPVAPNDTPENLKRNRRVELVVVPNVEEMLDLKSLTK